MKVTSKITVDLTRPNIGTRVNAVQGDGNTRYAEITLLSGGSPWIPPDDVEAAIAYRQPSGTKGLYNRLADDTPAISIEGNVATIILAPQMLAVAGDVNASIVFNNTALDQLTTFPFSVNVAANQYAGAQETEDYIRLQWLEDKLDEYIAKLGSGGGGVNFTVDETLTLKDGVLSVNTADAVEADNTLPVTSAAVNTTVGNIEILLAMI
ncbi:MAG: hypothetical protein ACI3V0_10685 [Faecousia sp.]